VEEEVEGRKEGRKEDGSTAAAAVATKR